MKRPLLVVASTSWNANFVQSTVELVSILALDREVIFVEYAYTWKDLFLALAKKKTLPWKKLVGLESRTQDITTRYGSALTLLYLPPTLPINWINSSVVFDFFNWINAKISKIFIKKALRKKGWNSFDVLNAWNPLFGVHFLHKLNEQKHLYYCYDEISAAKWIGKHGNRYEIEFAKKVDFVVVTSKQLLKNKQLYNQKTFWLPNGVDFDLFQQPHLKIKTPNHVPKVGYIGSIDDRLDLEVLEYSIQTCPDFEFVFVGRVTHPEVRDKLNQFPNVLFLPSQAPEKLPEIMKEFDVGTIPFVKNKFTENIYPMKINEYLAIGLPVVSTAFADLEEFRSICYLSSGKTEYVENLKKALSTDCEGLRKTRIQTARNNSWKNRALELEKWLE